MTAPRINSGGVSVFVKSVMPYFSSIHVFYRGRSSQNPSITNGILSGIAMPFRFLASLYKHKPDRVIINTSLGSSLLIRDGMLVAIAKMLGKKVLLIVHGFNPAALSHNLLLSIGYFRADAMIVLAESFKKQMIESGYKKPIYTQYNPIDERCLQYLSQNPERDRHKLNNILFLSRIEEAKGIYIVVDAFRLIANKHKDAVLNIVGNGSELENVKKYVNDNNIRRVNILGFKEKEDKYAVLADNDMLLFPSYREGLPICVLEAMAAGQLVITRPLGGLFDLYSECPFGAMIESLDPKDFAEAYENFVNNADLTEEVRRRNMTFAANFHPLKIVSNIQRILDVM